MSRTTVAILAGVLGFVLYAVVVVSLADAVLATHWILVAFYFLVAGVLWTWPAIRLMAWAARRD